MRENYTHIVLVLDGSGSMDVIKGGTLEGLNSFIKSQKEVEGEATFSLYQFSGRIPNPAHVPLDEPLVKSPLGQAVGSSLSIGQAPGAIWPFQYGRTIVIIGHKLVHDFKAMKEIKELTAEDYIPDGGTPLLDTIGYAIEETGMRLSALPESLRPGKVLFVIQTDGQENASKKYSKAKINEMIKHQTETYKWEFLFLGANQDAIQSGAELGISASRSLNYGYNNLSAGASLEVIGKKAALYRCAVGDAHEASAFLDMTMKDRQEAMSGTANTTGVVP